MKKQMTGLFPAMVCALIYGWMFGATAVRAQMTSEYVQGTQFESSSFHSKYGEVFFQKYQKNSKGLEKLAGGGDADAAYEIGMACVRGGFQKGLCSGQRDTASAKYWFQKAADLGYSNGTGEYFIGSSFEVDQTDINREEILFWLHRSDSHGSLAGRLRLAQYLRLHKANAADALESAALERKLAVENDDVSAEYNLGCDYENGSGVPKDATQAVEWFRRVEGGVRKAQGDPFGSVASYEDTIGDCYWKAGEAGMAVEYYLRASQEPDSDGLLPDPFNLPNMRPFYSYGKLDALQKLAEAYRDGNGVPANPEYAQAFLNSAQLLKAAIDAENNAEMAESQAQLAQAQAALAQLNHNRMNTIIGGALAGLGSSAYTPQTPTIQNAASQQTTNIQAAQVRAQAAQAHPAAATQPAAQAASGSPLRYTPPQPDPGGQPTANTGSVPAANCVDVGANHPCMPLAQYRQWQAAIDAAPISITPPTNAPTAWPTVATYANFTAATGPNIYLCPRSGYVLTGHFTATDVWEGEKINCTAGQQLNIMWSAGVDSSTNVSGQPGASGSLSSLSGIDPTLLQHLISPGDLDRCISMDFNGITPLGQTGWDRYTDNCGQAVDVTVAFANAKSSAGSFTLQPGQSAGTGNSQKDYAAQGGGYYFACPLGYGAADLNGQYLTVPIKQYICRQHGW